MYVQSQPQYLGASFFKRIGKLAGKAAKVAAVVYAPGIAVPLLLAQKKAKAEKAAQKEQARLMTQYGSVPSGDVAMQRESALQTSYGNEGRNYPQSMPVSYGGDAPQAGGGGMDTGKLLLFGGLGLGAVLLVTMLRKR
jgi:hypothetical protein